jgi:hypothetical protein
MVIEKQFQTSVSLHHNAMRDIFHSNSSSKWFYGSFLGASIILIILSAFNIFIGGRALSYSDFYPVVVIIFLFAYVPALQYWGVRRSFLSNPSAHQMQNYSFSEEGIRNYGRGIDIKLKWDKIIRIHKTKKFLLFFGSKNCAYFIPNKLVTNDEYKKICSWHKDYSEK